MFKKTFKTLFFVCAVMVAFGGNLWAEYPDHPIKIIVPFNAGGETDISARLLAAELEKVVGQSVVVQNIAGHPE